MSLLEVVYLDAAVRICMFFVVVFIVMARHLIEAKQPMKNRNVPDSPGNRKILENLGISFKPSPLKNTLKIKVSNSEIVTLRELLEGWESSTPEPRPSWSPRK